MPHGKNFQASLKSPKIQYLQRRNHKVPNFDLNKNILASVVTDKHNSFVILQSFLSIGAFHINLCSFGTKTV